VVIVHGTQRLRDRVPAPSAGPSERSTTLLGSWYATLLRFRPGLALFVNEPTLLPVIIPTGPARTLLARLPNAVPDVLAAHHVHPEFIDHETTEMAAAVVARTASRSVVGVMNEFGYLSTALRAEVGEDWLELSVRLAQTPCSPLYQRHISPDRELAALVTERARPSGHILHAYPGLHRPPPSPH
jgi:hypothetical protein